MVRLRAGRREEGRVWSQVVRAVVRGVGLVEMLAGTCSAAVVAVRFMVVMARTDLPCPSMPMSLSNVVLESSISRPDSLHLVMMTVVGTR